MPGWRMPGRPPSWLTRSGWFAVLLAAGFAYGAAAEAPAPAERPAAGRPLSRSAERLIWVDTDLVISPSGTTDPDDLVALEMLRRAQGAAPHVRIVGLSISAANGTLRQTRRAMREHASWLPGETVLDADCRIQPPGGAPPTAPVAAPAAAPASVPLVAPASVPGTAPMTVLALGPATNLPQLIDCLRRSGASVSEVVFVGGRRRGEEFRLDGRTAPHFRPMRDLNYEADRQAFRDLLATEAVLTGTRLTLVPFAAGNAVRLSLGDVAPVLHDGATFAAVRDWIASLAMVGGNWTMPGFDPAAASYLLWPEEFLCEPVMVDATGSDLLLVDGGAGWARRCLPQRTGEIEARIRDVLHRPIPDLRRLAVPRRLAR